VSGSWRWRETEIGAELVAGSRTLWVFDRRGLPPAAVVRWGDGSDGLWLSVERSQLPPSTIGFDTELKIRNGRVLWSSPLFSGARELSAVDWFAARAPLAAELSREHVFDAGAGGLIVVAAGGLQLWPDWTLLHTDGAIWSAPDGGSFRGTALSLRPEYRPLSSHEAYAPHAVARLKNARCQRGSWWLKAGDHRIEVPADREYDVELSVAKRRGARTRFAGLVIPTNADGPALRVVSPATQAGVAPIIAVPSHVIAFAAEGGRRARVVAGSLPETGSWFGGRRFSLNLATPAPSVFASEGLGDITIRSQAPPPIVKGVLLNLDGADLCELLPLDSQASLPDCVADRICKGAVVDLEKFSLRVRRMHDLLDVVFTFKGFQLEINRKSLRLIEKIPAGEHLVRVHFGPQTIAEEAFFIQGDPEGAEWTKTDSAPIDSKVVAQLYRHGPAGIGNEFTARLRTPPDTRPRAAPRAFAAGPSRLVYKVQAAALSREPLTLARLLEWDPKTWVLQLHPRAAKADLSYEENSQLAGRELAEPTIDQTAIEIPNRLLLSPVAGEDLAPLPVLETGSAAVNPAVRVVNTRISLWRHPHLAPSPLDACELWHTRFQGKSARAIWSPDFDNKVFTGESRTHPETWRRSEHREDPRFSLDARSRHELVALTSVFGLKAKPGTIGVQAPPRPTENKDLPHLYLPTPVTVSQLALSGAGGYVRLRGRWDPPASASGEWPALSVEDWELRHPWGVEELNRIVFKMFCVPLGIRMSLIEVTERKFVRDPLDRRVKAVLFQRLFVVLPQKKKTYPAVEQPNAARATDLRSVRFLISQTPDLSDPGVNSLVRAKDKLEHLNKSAGKELFWPTVNGTDPYLFRFEASDQGGGKTIRHAPLLLVSNAIANVPSLIADVVAYYRSLVSDADVKRFRTSQVSGQRVGYSPRGVLDPDTKIGDSAGVPERVPQQPADNAFETDEIVFSAELRQPAAEISEAMNAASQPPFYPVLERAAVRVPAIQRLAGTATPTTQITYDPRYIEVGFDPSRNSAQIFARILGEPVKFDVGGNSKGTGGVATPSTGFVALSARLGLVGGPSNPSASASPAANAAIAKPVAIIASTSPDAMARALAGAGNRIGFDVLAAADAPEDAIAKLQRGEFNPVDYFATALGDAKLFGVIPLVEVLKVTVGQLHTVPRVVEQANYAANGLVRPLFRTDVGGPGPIIVLLTRLKSTADDLARASGSKGLASLTGRIDELLKQGFVIAEAVRAGSPAISELVKFVSQGKSLVEDIQRIAADPSQLLPEGFELVVQVLEAARCFVADETTKSKCWLEPLETLARDVAAEVQADLYKLLRKRLAALQREPAVVEALRHFEEAATRVRSASTALQQELLSAGVDLLRTWRDYRQMLERTLTLTAQAGCDTAADIIQRIVELTHPPIEIAAAADLRAKAVSFQQAVTKVREKAQEIDDRIGAPARRFLIDINEATTLVVRTVEELLEPPPGRLACTQDPLDFNTLSEQARAGLNSSTHLATTIHRAFAGLKGIVERASRPIAGDEFIEDQIAAVRRAVEELIAQAIGEWIYRVNASGVRVRAEFETKLRAALDLLTEPVKKVLDPNVVANLEALPANTARCFQAIATANASGNPDDWRGALDKAIILAGAVDDLSRELGGAAASRLFISKTTLDELSEQADKLVEAFLKPVDAFAATLMSGLAALQQLETDNPRVARWLGPVVSSGVSAIRTDATQLRDAIRIRSFHVALSELSELTGSCKRLVDTLGSALEKGDLAGIVSLDAIVDELTSALQAIVPDKVRYQYGWTTKLEPTSGSPPVFDPDPGVDHLTINTDITVAVLSGQSSASLSGSIRRFSVRLLPSLPVIVIHFESIMFEAGSNQPLKYDVKIDDVKLEKQFEFVSALQKLMGKNTGPYVRPSLNPFGIEAGFKFGKDLIQMGGVTLQNLGLSLAFILPLNNSPATFRFRFSEADNPCLVSVGVYGGGMYLGLLASAGNLISVEGAFEFGAVTAISFGPLEGSGRVVAGIYFRIGGQDDCVSGYVLATGQGRLGWFGISILLQVRVSSKGGNVTGDATFQVSFDIGSFLTVTFTFTASYKFAGGGASNTQFPAPNSDGCDVFSDESVKSARYPPIPEHVRGRARRHYWKKTRDEMDDHWRRMNRRYRKDALPHG
jgi:hypothetical protein